jgi:hypothetical protein
MRNGSQQRGFAGVRIADQADVGNDPKFEKVVAFPPGFARLGEARGLSRRSCEIAIPQASAATLAQYELLAVLRQVNNQVTAFGSRGCLFRVFAREVNLHGATAGGSAEFGPAAGTGLDGGFLILISFYRPAAAGDSRGPLVIRFALPGFQLPHKSSAGNFDDQIFAGTAIHAVAHAELAVLRQEARLIILSDKIVEIMIGFQNDAAAASAVAATGAAFGTILLTLERDTAFAAVAGAGEDFYLVNEHRLKQKRRGWSPRHEIVIARSTGGGSRLRENIDAVAPFIERDLSVHQREERPIASGANVSTSDEFRAALADDNASGGYEFAAIALHAQTLADAIAPIPDAALTFLMCHKPMIKLLSLDFFNFHHRQFLPVADGFVVAFSALHLESDFLFAANVLDDVGHNSRATDGRRADGDLPVIADEQHAVKIYRLAGFDAQALDGKGVARGDTILFTSSF